MWVVVLSIILHCVRTATVQDDRLLLHLCTTHAHCTNLVPNSICFDRQCLCPFGYQSGECAVEKTALRPRRALDYGMRMLGEECDWTNQCRRTSIDGTKVCLARQCQCSPGFVPIDVYRCVPDLAPKLPHARQTKSSETEPPGYGSACSTNRDCQQTTIYLECLRGTCACVEDHVPLGKHLCFNIHGQSSSLDETSSMLPILPRTTSAYQPLHNDVLKSLGKLGNTCTNDYFCRRTVPQAHCYNGKCTCVEGFLSIDQYTCMKQEETSTRSTPIPIDYKSLLGGKCSIKRNCHTFNAICLNSICACPQGYFPVDDWTCLEVPESSDEELVETTSIITRTTSTLPSTTSTSTTFRWWPWSPTPSSHQPVLPAKNTFRVRCLLNRQCARMDKNSHCTLFGRCICNQGYQLETTTRGQRCIPRIINEHDCD